MTKREALRRATQDAALRSIGFTSGEAEQLRRISMTLHRWYELECGDGNGYIERDETTNRPYYVNCNSRYLSANDPRARYRIADREAGAIKRLEAILRDRNDRLLGQLPTVCPNCQQWQHATRDARIADCFQECRKRGFAAPFATLSYYLQTDPRGVALYILRPGDVPQGKDADAYYSHGIAVY